MANVLVTGATGFTGQYVVRRLVEAGHRVTAFVREGSRRTPLEGLAEGFVVGNLDDSRSLGQALEGRDALVNVASLGFGHAQAIVDAVDRAGIGRAIYFSTTSLFTTLPAATKSVRQQAEDVVRGSTVPWTIVRPTMIYGDPGDRNLIKLIRWVDRWKVVPVFGPGTYRLQPVHADDLAQAVVAALGCEVAAGQAYNLSGGTALSYNELVDLIGELLGRRPRRVHLPVSVSLIAVDLARRIPLAPRFSREQVLRLNEDKTFSHEEAARDLGYRPITLREGLAREVAMHREGAG
ncbi:Nucleoside-diphosphate-sugar epimerase [Singulisphaera sp. GP187]|uniref:NAD-dependent epimerase/dehydratase family protein n=1 Tax=Singulisphaera sp. GP187 TaxID=1882752 RepID=UPI0009283FC5|nr:NAD(P)H-binding protein [Singulisphaera sp. GP187]SIO55390.1 Nucleoside-diphosphate-sugar epimerase [Singulisphaera sp. GP187]